MTHVFTILRKRMRGAEKQVETRAGERGTWERVEEYVNVELHGAPLVRHRHRGDLIEQGVESDDTLGAHELGHVYDGAKERKGRP